MTCESVLVRVATVCEFELLEVNSMRCEVVIIILVPMLMVLSCSIFEVCEFGSLVRVPVVVSDISVVVSSSLAER